MTAAPDPRSLTPELLEQFWALQERARRLTEALAVSGESIEGLVDQVTGAKVRALVGACLAFSARLSHIAPAADSR